MTVHILYYCKDQHLHNEMISERACNYEYEILTSNMNIGLCAPGAADYEVLSTSSNHTRYIQCNLSIEQSLSLLHDTIKEEYHTICIIFYSLYS